FVQPQNQTEDGNQHDQSAGLGVDEELGGRIDACLLALTAVAPECDEKIHRHQHHFPEEEEQEQVHGQEYTGYATQDPHQVEVEETDAVLDLVLGTEHRQHPEDSVEVQQQQGQTYQLNMQDDDSL